MKLLKELKKIIVESDLPKDSFELSLLKFMKLANLEYEIDIMKSYRDTMGRKSICVSVTVFTEKPKFKKEYEENHCYQLNKKGQVVYDQGETIIDVEMGLLSYLGDNDAVDNYFDRLARDKAKEFFDEKF